MRALYEARSFLLVGGWGGSRSQTGEGFVRSKKFSVGWGVRGFGGKQKPDR